MSFVQRCAFHIQHRHIVIVVCRCVGYLHIFAMQPRHICKRECITCETTLIKHNLMQMIEISIVRNIAILRSIRRQIHCFSESHLPFAIFASHIFAIQIIDEFPHFHQSLIFARVQLVILSIHHSPNRVG